MQNVLVVDDNADNRELVSTLLVHRGHRVLQAADGAEALAIVRREHPKLVISDILMPTMDGFEFVRELRRDASVADTQVVFYTAHYHQREARSLADSCGVTRVLVKPCEPEEILRVIDSLLGGGVEPAPQRVTTEFDREHLRLMTDVLAQKAELLEAANGRLAALSELNVRLASERDPHKLLESVCRGARDLIGAKYAVLTVREKIDGVALFTTTAGIPAAHSLACPTLDEGPLAIVARSGESLRMQNLAGDPRDAGLPAGYPPAHAVVAAPVNSLSKTYGWLCLVDKVGAGRFDEEDEELLRVIAAQFGRVYENGSLYCEVQQHAAQLQLEIAERMRAAESLRESEERFRQVTETIQDAFYVVDPTDGRLLYLSPAYERIWGRSRREAQDGPRDWLASVHADDLDRVRAHVLAIRLSILATTIEYRIVRGDGAIRWILARTFPILGDDGRVVRLVGAAADITDRKIAEQKVQRLNRVYAVLSGINALIVRVNDRDELFREACRLAVEQGRFRMAWIGKYDALSGNISPAAWAGDIPEFLDETAMTMSTTEDADSLMPTAIRSQRPAICNDITTYPGTLRFRAAMLAQGYRSIVVLPLVMAGAAVGCLILAAEERDFFDAKEMRLLVELTGDIVFALDHIGKAEKLDHLAYYDALTGLANRTFFGERLSQFVAETARSGGKFALIHADIERFDNINSTYGRHIGDQVLKRVAERFIKVSGDPRAIGRIGSDQFSAVMPDVREETDVARRLQRWYHHTLEKPIVIDGVEIRVDMRAGIAVYPQDGADAESLLESSAAALKKAKSTEERFAFFTHVLSLRIAESAALELKLRHALKNEEFVLHYQPTVDLESRRMLGAEALMRWNSPELGLVPPGKFIPLMEESGMIAEAGAWALRQTARDRARWIALGLDPPRIAVNVSTVQLHRQDFVHTVAKVMKLAGAKDGIDIEVTESLIMEDVEGNIEKLKALRELGVGVAIDDFGTGHSSLGYLAKLPVDTLKIDRVFIAAMLDDPSAMILVKTMITLGHALKLRVVAEGVELEEQAQVLRQLGCDQMQGFLIDRPLPFHQMTARLERTRA